MKSVFGYVTLEETLGDTDGYIGVELADGSTELFCNYVEYGTNAGGIEEFTIGDGCNRYVPIRIEDIDGLIDALKGIRATSKRLARLSDKLDEVVSQVEDKDFALIY